MGRDWNKIGEIVEKVRELGLSCKDGVKRFGVQPWVLYDYDQRKKLDAREVALQASAKRER